MRGTGSPEIRDKSNTVLLKKYYCHKRQSFSFTEIYAVYCIIMVILVIIY